MADTHPLTREDVLRRAASLAEQIRADNHSHGATFRSAQLGPLDLSDFDSFSLLELVLACEDEFGVSLETAELERADLEELVDYIVANGSAPSHTEH